MTEQVTDNRMGAPVGPDEGQEVYDLAIIGAGGAFGAVIGASGISTAIVDVMQSWSIPVILLGFLMSQCLRIGLGSITVSIVTASAVLAPVASQLGASPVLVGLAICCGGIGLGLPNDSGFWTICKMSGLSTKHQHQKQA